MVTKLVYFKKDHFEIHKDEQDRLVFVDHYEHYIDVGYDCNAHKNCFVVDNILLELGLLSDHDYQILTESTIHKLLALRPVDDGEDFEKKQWSWFIDRLITLHQENQSEYVIAVYRS